MYLVVLTACLALSVLSSEAAVLDYSNIAPWSIAYSVYPVYNSEPLFEVWKNERSLNVVDNTVKFRKSNEKRHGVNLHKDVTDCPECEWENNQEGHHLNLHKNLADCPECEWENNQQGHDLNLHKNLADCPECEWENHFDDKNHHSISTQRPPSTHLWPTVNYKDWPKNLNKPNH